MRQPYPPRAPALGALVLHTGGMRAHYLMRCECCGAPIETGYRYVILYGRPWLPDHAVTYLRARRVA